MALGAFRQQQYNLPGSGASAASLLAGNKAIGNPLEALTSGLDNSARISNQNDINKLVATPGFDGQDMGQVQKLNALRGRTTEAGEKTALDAIGLSDKMAKARLASEAINRDQGNKDRTFNRGVEEFGIGQTNVENKANALVTAASVANRNAINKQDDQQNFQMAFQDKGATNALDLADVNNTNKLGQIATAQSLKNTANAKAKKSIIDDKISENSAESLVNIANETATETGDKLNESLGDRNPVEDVNLGQEEQQKFNNMRRAFLANESISNEKKKALSLMNPAEQLDALLSEEGMKSVDANWLQRNLLPTWLGGSDKKFVDKRLK